MSEDAVAHEKPAVPAVPVLFFDGECGLCNRLVRWLLRCDQAGVLRFAPLQGPTAQAYLRRHGLPMEDYDSIVFVPDWERRDRREFQLRTDGVVGALRVCGGAAHRWAGLIAIWPAWLRDAVYRGVARVRYRIFGPWKACPLPRPEWAQRFWR